MRWQRFVELRAIDGGNPELLGLLAGVLLRLDRAENYRELLKEVRLLGARASAACREIAEQIAPADGTRQIIRQAALDTLHNGGAADALEQGPPPKPLLLLQSFYKVIDREPPEDRMQPLIGYMRDEKMDKGQVLAALARRGDTIAVAHRAVIELLFATA